MLGQTHGPTHHYRLGGRDHLRDAFDLRPLKSGGGMNVIPVDLGDMSAVLVESTGVLRDELVIQHVLAGIVRIDQQRTDRLEEGEIPAQPDLAVLVGELGSLADDPAHALRVVEVRQARLDERVDRNDARAVVLGALQGAQHPRVIRSRILSGDQNQVGVLDVGKRDRAFADPDGLTERRPA